MRSTLNLARIARDAKLKIVLTTSSTLVLLITIFHVSGCRAPDAELERNKQLWSEGKVADYSFVIMRLQGGLYIWAPVLMQIRDGKTVSAQPTEKVGELVKVDYEDFNTIEKTFARIQESYNEGDKVTVIYNKVLGYPESIKVDPKGGGIDASYTIEISKFEIVRNSFNS